MVGLDEPLLVGFLEAEKLFFVQGFFVVVQGLSDVLPEGPAGQTLEIDGLFQKILDGLPRIVSRVCQKGVQGFDFRFQNALLGGWRNLVGAGAQLCAREQQGQQKEM